MVSAKADHGFIPWQVHLGINKNKMTKQNSNLIVEENDANKRLDVFLSEKLNISRSQAQKMIVNGMIKINDKTPNKTGAALKINNIISIGEVNAVASPKTHAKNNFLPRTKVLTKDILNVVYECPDYVIINKPSGVLVHPTPANETDTLTGALIKKYPEIKDVGENHIRPGIVHRLDREASGLLVVARTQKMFKALKKQFKERQVKKEYEVLVCGKILADEGVIDFPLERRTDGKMSAIPKMDRGLPNDKGKAAHTEFVVEKRFINYTLLSVSIHSGRMHQIRAHFLAYNHPVAGDELYEQRQYTKFSQRINRLFLHSRRLGFYNLKKEWVEYEIELPKELSDFLKTL